MSTSNKSPGALVEPLAMDSRELSDGDLSALSLSHSSSQYTNNDFQTLENIQAEFECMNAEEVMTTEEESVTLARKIESETIVPDIEMSDASENVQSEQIIYTAANQNNQNNQNLIFQTKPTLQRVPVSAIQVKQRFQLTYDIKFTLRNKKRCFVLPFFFLANFNHT